MSETEKIIRTYLNEVMGLENIDKISKEEDLKEHGMDSLNAIELVVSLEMEFGIEFDEEDLLVDNICSIKKLVDTVEKYLQEGGVR